MDFRLFVEPQNGATFHDQLAAARLAEEAGFDGFFRSDHFLAIGAGDGAPGPTDSWVTLGAIAVATSRLRLGTLVSSATFRHPSLTAIQVAQVDAMSGGRVDFGLGTGWFEAEHVAYGFPFPAKRFGPFQEQLEIITGLWSTPPGETFSYAGEHYTLSDSPALPKPAQARIPIIIGGSGATKTPQIAARFADEYNAFRASNEVVAERIARVRDAAAAAGRDPGAITFSLAGTTAIGGSEADIARRAEDAGSTPERLRAHGFAGTPAEVVDTLGALSELGVDRFYFQVMRMQDLEHIAFIGSEVLPRLR
ncbi:MAG TPA: TIGR03560 family F420-dependent LLM class oxidoreductase [Microbacteriaceae bacterium]|nr:TIGR03560 family F420-dependent LLM class oxidoreductase [Microbacteriaceae bacterium]